MNPTGGKVRTDRWGAGHFGASRGAERKHLGVDYEGKPGQWVVAPEAGKVTGEGIPYGDGGPWDNYLRFLGESGAQWKLFYCAGLPGIIGRPVVEGEVIGRMCNVSARYKAKDPDKWKKIGSMRPHVHLEKWVEGERVDPEGADA